MLSLHKQAAVRVSYAPGHRTQLLLLPSGLLLLRGVVSELLCWSRRPVIIVKGLLSVGLPVCIYLFHQFLCIVLGCRWDLDLHLLFAIGVGFDVCAVYKYCLGRKLACLRHFLQYPMEYLLYRLLSKTVPEIIAHRGKMGCFLLYCIPQKPAIGYI